MNFQLIRIAAITICVLIITADIREYLIHLTMSANMGLLAWTGRLKVQAADKNGRQRNPRSVDKKIPNYALPRSVYTPPEPAPAETPVPSHTPIPTGRDGNQVRSSINSPEDAKNINHSRKEADDKNPQTLFNTLTEHEKKELSAFKVHLTKVMQEWCLPKLVCELHATIGERTHLTEAEKGLLSIIKETSLNPMGEIISRYHFAAHMGQLLANVEGNGCHNLYPNCPLSGSKVLQMVKKVKIR